MRLYSTKSPNKFVDLKEAVFKGLPEDNGLFMPEHIPTLPKYFIKNLKKYSFQEIAYKVTKTLLAGARLVLVRLSHRLTVKWHQVYRLR